MTPPRYGIQFHPCGQIYYFTSPDAPLSLGTPVVVDTGHGENLGRIIKIVGARPDAASGVQAASSAWAAQSGADEPLDQAQTPGMDTWEPLSRDLGETAAESEFADVGGSGVEDFDSAREELSAGATDALTTDVPGGKSENAADARTEGPGGNGDSAAQALDEGGEAVEPDSEGDSEGDGQELSAVLSAALDPNSPNLAPIKRVAGPRDLERAEQNEAFALKAGKYCTQCATEHRLDMKLVHTEVSLDSGKLIFFFTAAGRIDFRELVKALARNFHARIELRQIGVRHETQLVGAIGNCGMVCCCRRYMRRFAPVTIKMAKEQGLFLNPVKISGTCGRLLCCLSFEQHNYEEFHGRCPKLGKKYETTRGIFKVLRASLFRNSLTLLPEMGDELEVTLEEWAAMEPARYDAARRQRTERDVEKRTEGEAGDMTRREGGSAGAERGDERREDNRRGDDQRGGRERGRRRPEQDAAESDAPERGGRRREPRQESQESRDGRREGREGRQEGRRNAASTGEPGRAPNEGGEGKTGQGKGGEVADANQDKGGNAAGVAGAAEPRPNQAQTSASGTGLSRFLAAASGGDDEDER